MLTCETCGEIVPEGTQYCPNCGHGFPARPPVPDAPVFLCTGYGRCSGRFRHTGQHRRFRGKHCRTDTGNTGRCRRDR